MSWPEATPFAIEFNAGGRPIAPRWRVWAATWGDVDWRELPWRDGRIIVPADMVTPIPDAVPDARAVLAANMETAVNILWDARPLIGERALVLGAGVVGLLAAALLARIPGVDLAIADPDPARRAPAEALGLRFVAPEDAPAERDLIIHASGHPDGLRQALTLAGFEGRIVEASWFGDRDATLPLGEAFHAKRLSIIATQVGAPTTTRRLSGTTTSAAAEPTSWAATGALGRCLPPPAS